MKRGPIPKPAAVKALTGRSRTETVHDGELLPLVRAPKVPDHLDPIARSEWDRLVPILLGLRVLAETDRAMLAAYCVAYSRWVQAEAVLQDKGMTFETGNNYPQARPEVAIANQALKLMERFAQHFGLSPASRTRIAPMSPKKPKTNPFDD